jgi:hypothetical protein
LNLQKPSRELNDEAKETEPIFEEDVRQRIEHDFVSRLLRERLNPVRGIVWAFLISIPIWIILAIVIAKLLD